MFLFTVGTYVRSLETNGYVLSFNFFNMISRDAITLAITDAILVLSTGICVPFAKAVSKGWIKYYWTGIALQHTLQSLILFTAITWTFNREWPWVQSGFLTLHSLVMIMKMHSYMTVNGFLQYVSKQAQSSLEDLRKATISVGGWEKAIADARAHRAELDAVTSATSEGSGGDTPDVSIDGTRTSYVDASTAAALRKRLVSASAKTEENGAMPAPTPPSSSGPPPSVHPLVDHPEGSISSLAKAYSELRGELTSSGPEQVQWPSNITFKNFAMYQLIPTLVYDLEYPRTDRIRPIYLFEKTAATFGTFALLYTVTESFIIPLTPTPDQSFFRSLLDLALPFMIAYLLLFFIIFECICNWFAEISYFADRQFYEDWWNSTSWDEFSRKWNKPVHTFLLRHVYSSTISSFGISRTTAMFITFLLSAAAHEMVMVVVTQKIRLYLFLLQLIQIPLIAISRMPAIKRNKLLGNVVFWLGLYAGFPLLCVAYVAY